MAGLAGDDRTVSALLAKQLDKEILYGNATVTVYEGFTSLDVTGHYMPDLQGFGPPYDAYGFAVLDPDTCRVLMHQRMVLVDPAVNTWTGAMELGMPPHGFAGGLVIVYPLEASGAAQIVPVLAGTVRMSTGGVGGD